MRILFLGDSLTQGTFGVSYLTLLRRRLRQFELINAGKNGETVIGLYHRLKKSPVTDHMDMIFLWIGVNDVLAKVSWNFPFCRIVLNEPWAHNHDIYKEHYKKILKHLALKTDKIIAVSPLFIGENYQNKWNKEIQDLYAIINQLSKQYDHIETLEIQKIFINKLKGKNLSPYLPKNIIKGWTDAATLRSIKQIDEKACERGLHFTFDGVHLNSAGAKLVAETFLHLIKQEKK